ncbi:hypothetical protein HYE34_02135 [Mycoplasmopsis bovis]|nr:hypothetical protein HYE34_02135 [Mycoplasmopsis bovis]
MKSTQNDMPTENSEINDYLNKVKEYGKEAYFINHPIRKRKEREEKLMNY